MYPESIEEYKEAFCWELYSEEYEEIMKNDVDNTTTV